MKITANEKRERLDKRLVALVRPSTFEALDLLAEIEDVSVASIVRRALRHELETRGEPR